MAAFTPAHSAEWLAFVSTPPQLAGSYRWGSKTRISSASLTFTGAGTGTAKMLRLPAGKIRILTDLCRIVAPAGTATADLHVGYAAHVHGSTGAAVVADDNAFANDLDLGSAIDAAWSLPAVGYLDLDSADGVDIEVMVDTEATAATGEMFVAVVYQMGN